jgi:uncharacterized CHY-type Zn-finger protein
MKVRCEQCGKEFESSTSEEEAAAEVYSNFGQKHRKDDVVVCGSCYEEFMEWFRTNVVPNQ